MKKAFLIILSLIMAFSLAACGSDSSSESEPPVSSQTPEQSENASSIPSDMSTPDVSPSEPSVPEADSLPEESKALIVYFSWSGNTESVANEIQAQTDADIFRIIPAEPYTDDYDTLLDVAQNEQSSDARPEISGSIEGFDGYDTVYVGFPNWWGDMPMILYTFFDSYDLSGKTVAPFVTSGGSGFSGTISTMQELEPDAALLDGLSLGSSAAKDPADDVSQWLADIGLGQ